MKLRSLTLGVAVLGFLPAGCGKKEFKEFSPDGKFKVMMPGSPAESKQTAAGAEVKIWSVELGNGGYMVAAADFPTTGGADIDTLLDGAVRGAASNSGATVTNQSKITLAGKHPGREFEGSVPSKGAFLRARMYMVDTRLYQLLVLGKNKEFIDLPDTGKFLDSFQLVQ